MSATTRSKEARRRGDATRSPALAGAAALVGAAAGMIGFAPLGAERLLAFGRRSFAVGEPVDLAAMGRDAVAAAAYLVGPAAACAVLAAGIVGLLQARGLFAPRAIVSNEKAPRGRGRDAGAIGLSAVALAVVLLLLRRESSSLLALLHLSGATPILDGASLAGRVSLRLGFALLAVGAIDFAWRSWRERRALETGGAQGRRAAREDGADPRLLAEARRRQRSTTSPSPTQGTNESGSARSAD